MGAGGKWKCAYTTGWLVQPEKLDAGRRTSLVAAQQVQPCYQSKPKPSFVSSRRQVQPGSTLVPVQTRTKFIIFLQANASQYKVQKLQYNPNPRRYNHESVLFKAKYKTKGGRGWISSAAIPVETNCWFLVSICELPVLRGAAVQIGLCSIQCWIQSTFSFEWVAVLCTSICDGIF